MLTYFRFVAKGHIAFKCQLGNQVIVVILMSGV